MRIAIIGGGITGLTAGYHLTKNGHTVTIFEKESSLGGLAGGFKPTFAKASAGKGKGWDWPLEKTYHHFFTNDDAMFDLIHELGIGDKVIIKRPITATLMPQNNTNGGSQQNFVRLQPDSHSGLKKMFERPLKTDQNFRWRSQHEVNSAPKIFQLDSPMNLLTFPYLSPIDKFRTASLLAFLKLNPFWQPLENITAKEFFTAAGGPHAWDVLWEPLMQGKFGEFAPKVAASWLWARVKKRTPKLCYIDGGFQTLIDALAKAVKENGGTIRTNTAISSISKLKKFDAVLLTTPTQIAAKLAKFPASYIQPLLQIPHLYAQTLIVETKEPILEKTYWLNINDRKFPFLAAVAHTNFMDTTHYAGHHLTYFGNYLPAGHPYLSMTKQQILKLFLPYIKRLIRNSSFKIHNSYLFTAPFAQPVHELQYSKRAPTIQTPIPNVYVANLDSIYPWDRGTNYAVELGQKAAKEIMK